MKKLEWPPVDVMMEWAKTQRYHTFISGMLSVMGDQHDNNLDSIVNSFDTQLELPLVGGKNPTDRDVDIDL
jgi:hypothetical protein